MAARRRMHWMSEKTSKYYRIWSLVRKMVKLLIIIIRTTGLTTNLDSWRALASAYNESTTYQRQ